MTEPPWDFTEAERRQFREAHAAARENGLREARYPATPARVAADLRELGYLVATGGELGWRVYWDTAANSGGGVRVELPDTPANNAVTGADLDHLARLLRERGWTAEAVPGGVVVTATTTPPPRLPSELGVNSDDADTAWTLPFRRRAAE
jgi:hypothetical protein